MGNQIFNLAGKTALITGGNGGIGLGFARGIAKQGGNICIWGRNEEKNKMALSELLSFGIEVEALTVDVNEEQSVQSAFRQTLEIFDPETKYKLEDLEDLINYNWSKTLTNYLKEIK